MEKTRWWQDWRQRPVVRLFTLPSAMILFLAGLVFLHGSTTLAAERVLEPDKALRPAPEAAPAEPLLEEGTVWRTGGYRDKKISLGMQEDAVYRGFLLLVNYEHLLPEEYAAADLAAVRDLMTEGSPMGFDVSRAGMQADKTAAEQLLAMVQYAGEKDGITGYLMQSGYRDFSYQTTLYQNKVRQYRNMGYTEAAAREAAAVWVARPKESEHHTGLALDVASRSHPALQTSYYDTENGGWLDENSWRFGFVIRYPKDKTDITMIGYEPWHLRYVGRPHSDFIRQRGWCLEEYCDFLWREGGYTFRDEDGAIWQVDYQPLKEGGIQVPADRPYTVSGDGNQGFFVTVLTEPAAADAAGQE